MIPTLLVIFGIGLQYFGNHYNTYRHFHCINDRNVNCSLVQYCSQAGNRTDCCMDDSVECTTNHLLIQKLDIITVLCVPIAVVMFASSWIHASIFHHVGNNLIARIRRKLFQSLLYQDIKWFDVSDPKELTSRMTE